MAVPKTTRTRYMDGSVQRTPYIFIFVIRTKLFSNKEDTCSIQKRDVGMVLLACVEIGRAHV